MLRFMKYLVRISLYVFSFSILYSCFKPETDMHRVDYYNDGIAFRHSSNADTVESLDWDGNVNHDCQGPGTKCVVIRPKGAKIAIDFINAVNTAEYASFFQSPEGVRIPLSQEVKDKIISGELMVYPKEKASANEIQFRIK
jgi:hypothetical protein